MHACIMSPKHDLSIDDPWFLIRYNRDDFRIFLCTTIIVHKFFATSWDVNKRRLLINWIALLILYRSQLMLNRFFFPFNNDDTSRAMKMKKKAVKDSKYIYESPEVRDYRKPIDEVTSTRYWSRRDPSKNKGLTTVGLLHGHGTVCPIRSDRYSTPPYNLHGLMTSITLLCASAALRTARVVRSLGHGPRYATPVGADQA